MILDPHLLVAVLLVLPDGVHQLVQLVRASAGHDGGPQLLGGSVQRQRQADTLQKEYTGNTLRGFIHAWNEAGVENSRVGLV